MSRTDGTRGEISTRLIVVGVAAALALIGAVGVSAAAVVWQTELADHGRVLPGTTVGGVKVGERTVEEVRELVDAEAAEMLTRPVTLVHDEQRWKTTAAALGGTVDVDAALSQAVERTRDAGLQDAVAARWFGAQTGAAVALSVRLDEQELDAFVDTATVEAERPARDATIALEGGTSVVVPAQVGYEVDRTATRQSLRAALQGAGDGTVGLVANALPYDVATDEVEPLLVQLGPVVEWLLARTLAVRVGEQEWTTTPGELGAELDLEPTLATLVHEQRTAQAASTEMAASVVAGQLDVPEPAVDVSHATVAQFVDRIADEADAPVRDAAVEEVDGWVELTPHQRGTRVDRDRATDVLAAAIAEGAEQVDLPVEVTEPEVTADAFSHVLLVRLDQRRLYLYRDGEIVRDWPVATGAPGYNTPAGRFVVGLKRAAPTWHNPAPNGWGADMPLVVEPGPNNPLGLRALNWVREDGRQTLIRFHGTSNLRSIGTAASKGCIRLANGDIVELFDLVPTGTTIISTWG